MQAQDFQDLLQQSLEGVFETAAQDVVAENLQQMENEVNNVILKYQHNMKVKLQHIEQEMKKELAAYILTVIDYSYSVDKSGRTLNIKVDMPKPPEVD